MEHYHKYSKSKRQIKRVDASISETTILSKKEEQPIQTVGLQAQNLARFVPVTILSSSKISSAHKSNEEVSITKEKEALAIDSRH